MLVTETSPTPPGASARRTIPLEDYFLAYGEQDRAPGEFVESVRIPRPAPGTLVSIVKLSKRFDSDISAISNSVNCSMRQKISGGCAAM